ncbi:hypothetical protein HY933_03765 [Candidatus Falkowbacteria bacterium]|nr:hypothetical protein [Candidatus Falkowbacteria bacterium]
MENDRFTWTIVALMAAAVGLIWMVGPNYYPTVNNEEADDDSETEDLDTEDDSETMPLENETDSQQQLGDQATTISSYWLEPNDEEDWDDTEDWGTSSIDHPHVWAATRASPTGGCDGDDDSEPPDDSDSELSLIIPEIDWCDLYMSTVYEDCWLDFREATGQPLTLDDARASCEAEDPYVTCAIHCLWESPTCWDLQHCTRDSCGSAADIDPETAPEPSLFYLYIETILTKLTIDN